MMAVRRWRGEYGGVAVGSYLGGGELLVVMEPSHVQRGGGRRRGQRRSFPTNVEL
jgi:hypothetical protein